METYNGWTNYETWAWNLWITNEQGSYEYWIERAQQAIADAAERDDAIVALTDELSDSAEQDAEDFIGERVGPLVDILNAGVSAVNWYEIAEHFIDAVAERATHHG